MPDALDESTPALRRERVQCDMVVSPAAFQRAYWDQVAWGKKFNHPVDFKRFGRLVPKTARILDVGCGYGRLGAGLGRRGWRAVVGVDPSREMIRRGRRKHPGLDLRVLRWNGYAPESFDAVLLFTVLTSIPADRAQQDLLRRARRVLKPGGILYVSDLLLQTDARNRRRYALDRKRFGRLGIFELLGGGVMRHHSRGWLGDLLSGFERIAWKELDVVTMDGHRARGFQYFGRKPAGQDS